MTAFLTTAILLAASIVSVPTPPGVPSMDVTAHQGKVFQTSKAGDSTQGFVEIQNAGSADTLNAVECPIADSTSVVDGSGKSIPSLPIPAGQTTVLSQSGPHLLLQSTHFSVQYGGMIPCSLTFANAGTVSVFLYATPAP